MYLRMHLENSPNPACQTILCQLDQDLSSEDDSADEEAPKLSVRNRSHNEHAHDLFPIHPTGDYFGDYRDPSAFEGLLNEDINMLSDNPETVRLILTFPPLVNTEFDGCAFAALTPRPSS
jgi:hypothetical protein